MYLGEDVVIALRHELGQDVGAFGRVELLGHDDRLLDRHERRLVVLEALHAVRRRALVQCHERVDEFHAFVQATSAGVCAGLLLPVEPGTVTFAIYIQTQDFLSTSSRRRRRLHPRQPYLSS